MTMRRVEVGGNATLERVLRDTEAGEAVVLTKRGRPRALVVRASASDSWRETAALLRDPGLLDRIASAERAIRRGRVKTLDEVFPRRSRRGRQ